MRGERRRTARGRSTSTGTSTSCRRSRGAVRAAAGDGRIVGRGTADMKGGLVGMLYGAAAARELGLLGDGRIVLHLVCDEETGSVDGLRAPARAGLIDPGAVAMLTPEPTGGVVWHASRGAITLRVEVRGGRRTWARRTSASTRSSTWCRRRAARGPRTSPAGASHRLPARERRGARLDAGRRRRVGQRRELQRRAGGGLVLRRPALQPRGGHSTRSSRG